MRPKRSVTFVVMAGGKGERLWPLVRASRPKVCLSPDGKQTLLESTIQRLHGVWPSAHWLIVTTHSQAEVVRASLPAKLRRAVLVEPQIKNTAAAITLAALSIADPHRVMVVVPADHWIEDVRAFRQAVRAAIHAAVRFDTIATIGIRPTSPHAGLGYLCVGSTLDGSHRPRLFQLDRFVEKPSSAVAKQLIAQGAYWNGGYFVGRVDKFLECITEWLPDHTRRLAPVRMRHDAKSAQRLKRAYRALDAVSFDHGVMDHLRTGVVVEGRFAWADLGTWDAWARLSPASACAVAVGSHNVKIVNQEQHLVATVGVRDLVIVHTPTATLICSPEKTQLLREVVRRLSLSSSLRSFL